jgi:hypothetical protein
MAVESQGGVEDQASSWSVISTKNTCDIFAGELSDDPVASDSSAADYFKMFWLRYLS